MHKGKIDGKGNCKISIIERLYFRDISSDYSSLLKLAQCSKYVDNGCNSLQVTFFKSLSSPIFILTTDPVESPT